MHTPTRQQLEIMQAMSELLWVARVKSLSVNETEHRFQQLCAHFRHRALPRDLADTEAELERWQTRLSSLRHSAFIPQAI